MNIRATNPTRPFSNPKEICQLNHTVSTAYKNSNIPQKNRKSPQGTDGKPYMTQTSFYNLDNHFQNTDMMHDGIIQ